MNALTWIMLLRPHLAPLELWQCRRVCSVWREHIDLHSVRMWKGLCVRIGVNGPKASSGPSSTRNARGEMWRTAFCTWIAAEQKRVMWLVVGSSFVWGVEKFRLCGAYVKRSRAARVGRLVYCADDLDLSNSAHSLLTVGFVPLPFPDVISRLQMEQGSKCKRELYVRRSFILDAIDCFADFARQNSERRRNKVGPPVSPWKYPMPFIDAIKTLPGWSKSVLMVRPEDNSDEWVVTFVRY